MKNEDKISWSALEYEEKEHGNDWFWALGIIVVAGATASFIYSNYFFGIFLIIGGLLLGFLANEKPNMINYELNAKGLRIKDQLIPYKEIKSFWVEYGSVLPSTLFIKSGRLLMPMASIPLTLGFEEEIKYTMLENNVLEEEMKEHASEKILNFLGF